MKKKIIIFMFIIFITGCSVEYELQIKDDNFFEKINIDNFNSNNYNLSNLNLSFYSDSLTVTDTTSYEELSKFEKYDKKINDNNIEYFYDFNVDNYYDSNVANNCYDYFKVNKDGNNVTITTSNSFNCFKYYKELDNVTVNITSHYGVVQSNADKVSGKKHTWNITPQNAENKPIIFVYDESKKNITLLDYIKDNYILFLIIFVFAFIVLPILLFIKIRTKKVNKI